MRWPFVSRRQHEAEMAALESRLQHYVMAAGVYQRNYEDKCEDVSRLIREKLDLKFANRALQVRLDALTPARREDGRFVKREAIHRTDQEPATLANSPVMREVRNG